MSFWFPGKAKNGKQSLYSVSIPLPAILSLVLMLVMFLLGALRGCAP